MACTAAIAKYTEQEKDLRKKIEANSSLIDSVAKHIDTLQETINFIDTVHNLDVQRNKLKDNHECPLCGSTTHPFAAGNIPETGEKKHELISLKQQQSELSKQLQSDERLYAKTVSDRENAELNKSKTEKLLAELRTIIEQTQSSISGLTLNLSDDADCIAQLEKIRIEKVDEFKNISQTISEASEIEISIKKLRDEVIPKYQIDAKSAETAMNEAEKLKVIVENNKTNAEKNVEQSTVQYNAEQEKLRASFEQYEVENISKLKNCFQQWIVNEEQLTKLAQQKLQVENELRITDAAVENNQRQSATEKANRENIENEKQQLEDKRRQLFAEKNVDEEEKGLKSVVAERERSKSIAEK